MQGADLTASVLTLVGGLGLGALLGTYWQVREARKARKQDTFRQVVLVHPFMTFLGILLEFSTVYFSIQREGLTPELIGRVNSLSKQYTNQVHEIRKAGIFFFFPIELTIKIGEVDRLLREVNKMLAAVKREADTDTKGAIIGSLLWIDLNELGCMLKGFLGVEEKTPSSHFLQMQVTGMLPKSQS